MKNNIIEYLNKTFPNPYHIYDGPWGGMGQQSWFRLDKNNPANVFHEELESIEILKDKKTRRKYKCYNYSHVAVWDNSIQKWRESKWDEKHKRQTKDYDYKNRRKFSTIFLPRINRTFPELIALDIINVQPMALSVDTAINKIFTEGFWKK